MRLNRFEYEVHLDVEFSKEDWRLVNSLRGYSLNPSVFEFFLNQYPWPKDSSLKTVIIRLSPKEFKLLMDALGCAIHQGFKPEKASLMLETCKIILETHSQKCKVRNARVPVPAFIVDKLGQPLGQDIDSGDAFWHFTPEWENVVAELGAFENSCQFDGYLYREVVDPIQNRFLGSKTSSVGIPVIALRLG